MYYTARLSIYINFCREQAYVSFGLDTTYDLVGAFLHKLSLHVIYCIIP